MKQNKITIPKTAFYCTYGTKGDSLKNIWLVCHGYGQLAKFFIRNFKSLNENENFVIAPEGLHKFYLNGFSGRVGASWMTKEERENDIFDYNNYLNEVFQKELSEVDLTNVRVNMLGFSQGCATISRFLFEKNISPDSLILWAGDLPKDINLEDVKNFSNEKSIYFVIGNKDEFISINEFKEILRLHTENSISFHEIIFEGKHQITSEALIELKNQLDK